MTETIKFALAIKILRESRGLSASELSIRAGLAPYIVSRLERGKLNLDFLTAMSLAKELDISLELLAETAKNLPPELLEQETKLIQAREEIKKLKNESKVILKNSLETNKNKP